MSIFIFGALTQFLQPAMARSHLTLPNRIRIGTRDREGGSSRLEFSSGIQFVLSRQTKSFSKRHS